MVRRLGAVAAALVGAATVGALAVSAAAATSAQPGATTWSAVVDVTVGLAFVLAGVLARGPLLMRALVTGVGVAWLLGSALPEARLAHQAVLAVVLVAFPGAWPVGTVRKLLVVAAVPVGLGLVPQIMTAALFAAIAATAVPAPTRRISAGMWYPSVSALAMALSLAGWWTWSRVDPATLEPAIALLVYEALLTGTAVTYPFAAGAVAAARDRVTDLALGDVSSGLDGLASVLAEMLGDPGLRVHGGPAPWPEAAGRRQITVWDGSAPIAVVEYTGTALEDPATAEAVATAVRLTVRHVALEAGLQEQLADLEAARARLVAATDRQRQATAARLRKMSLRPCERPPSRSKGRRWATRRLRRLWPSPLAR